MIENPVPERPQQPPRTIPSIPDDDFTDTAPTMEYGTAPTMGYGTAPTATVGTTATIGTTAPAGGTATAVLEAPRNHGVEPGALTGPKAAASRPVIARNESAPGFLGVANVVVSALVTMFWLWLPIALFFAGIGGLFALGSGVICLALWLFLQRGINHVERLRAEAIYRDGIEVPATPRSDKTGVAGFLDTQWRILKSSVFWRSTAHHYVKALYGLFAVVLALTGMSIGLNMLGGAINPDGAGFYIGSVDLVVMRLLNGSLGTVFILVGAALLWFAPYLDRALDRGLLPPTQTTALRAEVRTLDNARAGAVDAATQERLRIERDLHDGVQPMLVATSMKLGMAKSKIDTDPEAAKLLLTEAHTESKAAITELRQLARGIHPAVLTDRGLDPAISALAARSPIPVDVTIDLPDRPAKESESVAYFVIAEALTNINKHSDAGRARVSIVGDGDSMQISVSDDGRGGARVSRDGSHTGLSGLVDRVTAARGTWTLTSPVGGPTTIVVELPCAS